MPEKRPDAWGLDESGAVAAPLSFVRASDYAAWRIRQPPALRDWSDAFRFGGRVDQVLAVAGERGRLAHAVAGLGDRDPADPLAYARLPATLPAARFAVDEDMPAEQADAIAIGWALGAYGARREGPLARIIWPKRCRRDQVGPLIRAEVEARGWIDRPAAELGPADLADLVRTELAARGAKVRVVDAPELASAGYPGLVHVGRGSTRPPVLADAHWGPTDAPKLTLVGKGVCFDAGGINLKPYPGVYGMQADMAGAAHALALARLVIDAGLRVRLRVLIPAADNMPSGSAMMNGDIVTTASGQTVEIAHTDYEGRVMLADALIAADADAPDLLVDFGSLTDSGLGPDLAGFFTEDDALATELARHAARLCDPLWRLPFWEPYAATLQSRIADLSNREGGDVRIPTLAAALFLKRFVRRSRSWLHFDIEGWNTLGSSGRPLGGNVTGLRAVFALIQARYRG